MMSLNEWKELAKVCFIAFFAAIILEYIISEIIVKIKNKRHKRTGRHVTHRTAEIDLCEYLMANMKQEYIGQKKVIFNELIKM